MTDAAWHALVIVSFLLVGVPSNVAVLWIHTRKEQSCSQEQVSTDICGDRFVCTFHIYAVISRRFRNDRQIRIR